MNSVIVERHRRPPSALHFMSRALLGSRRLPKQPEFPPIVERWEGVRIGTSHETRFRQATGLDGTSILYPHVLGFRLQMAMLTHPAFPLPIWNTLQIRNRLISHRPLRRDDTYTFETCIGDHRFVEKGIEVDLKTRLVSGDRCDWESAITYFYRGRFSSTDLRSSQPAAPDLSGATVVATFRTPRSGGWAFGGLTGDYNGIHTWRPYARRFGFPSAFMHPQRSAALCLKALGLGDAKAGTLRLWIKGPVFYDTEVTLVARNAPDGRHFGLSLAGDVRRAIVGSWSAAT